MKLKIRELRVKKKITQDELSELSGIKKRTLIDYESGKSDIPISKLQNIATALNVSIFDLIQSEKEISEDEKILIEEKLNLDKEIIDLLQERIKLLEENRDLYKERSELLKIKLEECLSEKKPAKTNK